MNLTNYHSHCNYCDGHAPMELFIKKAIELNFTSYGISSHAPMLYPTASNMDWAKVNDYIAEARSLQSKYQEQIAFYLAFEFDYLDEHFNPAMKRFQELDFDYCIGSLHHLANEDGHFVDIDTGAELFQENVHKFFHHDIEEIVVRYFSTMRQMITMGGFDILGHCDKISENASIMANGLCESTFYKDLVRDYFEFIASQGCIVEVNTKRFTRSGLLFPNVEHFKLLRDLEIPLIINSDAHRIERINSGRTEALKALVQAKYDTVIERIKNEWIAVPIHSSYRI